MLLSSRIDIEYVYVFIAKRIFRQYSSKNEFKLQNPMTWTNFSARNNIADQTNKHCLTSALTTSIKKYPCLHLSKICTLFSVESQRNFHEEEARVFVSIKTNEISLTLYKSIEALHKSKS